MSEVNVARMTGEPEVDRDQLSQEVIDLAARLRKLADSGRAEALEDGPLQEMVSTAIAIYAQKAEQRGEIFSLKPSGGTNATAVLMATSALLKGSSIELFELGMWQTWSGMK